MTFYHIRSTIAWFPFLVMLSFGCEIGDSPSEEELNQLPQNWVVSSVSIDGFDDTATNYSNFRLSFNADGTYSAQDIYGMPENGSWEVNNDQLLLLPTQGAEKVYIIISLSAEMLVLLFEDEFFKENKANFRYTLVPE